MYKVPQAASLRLLPGVQQPSRDIFAEGNLCDKDAVLGPTTYEGRSESKERLVIQRYLLIIGKKRNMQVLSHTFTYFSTQSPWTLRHLSYCDISLLIPSSYQTAAWLFNQSMTACCRSSSSVNPLPPGNYLHSTEHTKRLIWYNKTPARVV